MFEGSVKLFLNGEDKGWLMQKVKKLTEYPFLVTIFFYKEACGTIRFVHHENTGSSDMIVTDEFSNVKQNQTNAEYEAKIIQLETKVKDYQACQTKLTNAEKKIASLEALLSDS